MNWLHFHTFYGFPLFYTDFGSAIIGIIFTKEYQLFQNKIIY